MKKRDDAIEEKLGDWCIVQTSCNQQKDGSSCGVFALMVCSLFVACLQNVT